MACVGRDLNDHLIPTPLPLSRFPTARSSTRPGCPRPQPNSWLWTPLGMRHPQPLWATYSSTLPLSHCKTSPRSNVNLHSFSLKPFLLVLSLSTCVKTLLPSCLQSVLKYYNAIMRSPHGLLFSSLSPASSVCLHRRGAPALRSSSWPSSGPSPKAPHPLCDGCPTPGCSTPEGDSQGRSRGEQSPSSPCWPPLFLIQPRIPLAFWTGSAHYWLVLNVASTRLLSFFAGLLSSSSPSLHTYLGLPWPRCKTLHFTLLNLIWLTWTHLSSVSMSFWMASLPPALSTVLPRLVSSAILLRVQLIPSYMSLIKMLKSTSPKTDAWGTPLVTNLHLDIEPLTTTLSETFQPIPYPPNSPTLESISPF